MAGLVDTQESNKAAEMIRMIDLFEVKAKKIEQFPDMRPYADGSEKFKNSKESQETLEKTTK